MANTKEIIQQLMVEQNIKSMRQLETMAGVSLNIISKWDKMQPSAENLSKVAKVLNVSPNYLLYGEQENEEQSFITDERKTPTRLAVGENEVLLLDTFRKLNNTGRFKILMLVSEEYDNEQASTPEEKDSAPLSNSAVG